MPYGCSRAHSFSMCLVSIRAQISVYCLCCYIVSLRISPLAVDDSPRSTLATLRAMLEFQGRMGEIEGVKVFIILPGDVCVRVTLSGFSATYLLSLTGNAMIAVSSEPIVNRKWRGGGHLFLPFSPNRALAMLSFANSSLLACSLAERVQSAQHQQVVR